MLPSTVDVAGVSIGGGSLVLIAGPCVIESEAHAVETALALRDIARRAGVPFVFKALVRQGQPHVGRAFRGPGSPKACACSPACAKRRAFRS